LTENPNRDIYTRAYTAAQLELHPGTAWDAHLVDLRLSLIRELGTGKDVLDLCCGSGAYLLPNLERFRSAVAVDFSPTLLEALRERLGSDPPLRPTLIEADVQELPLPDTSVDFAWSYTSLYYVPALDRALAHVARVLRPGGHAALELGNSQSLNEIVSAAQHRDAGSARLYARPYSELRQLVTATGLEILDWRTFQLLTMYGAPRRLRLLGPLFSARWKSVLGRQVAGKMLDEWLSSTPPLRRFAFRHLVVARKP
jgi:ubiquinone/menaquinone biosynthesis C-methylase UbiE